MKSAGMKFALLFIGSALALFCFFWFYPAEIFAVSIRSGLVEIETDVCLKTIFLHQDFPQGIAVNGNTEVKVLTQAWMLMAVCLLGLPLMIALRFSRKTTDKTDLNTDQK